MRFGPDTTPRDDNWRKRLPPYGEPASPPVVQATPIAPAPVAPVAPVIIERRRSSAAGWLVALGLGAAIAALVIYNQDDPRSIGTQLDDAVSSVRGLGDQVGQTVAESQNAAAQVSRSALDGVTTAIDDGAISLKVKTALAADPALSAARIEVTTTQGIVRLEGPAPNATAKERATVLAGAPEGVRGVDNRLALPQPGQVVAVVEGSTAPPSAQPPAVNPTR